MCVISSNIHLIMTVNNFWNFVFIDSVFVNFGPAQLCQVSYILFIQVSGIYVEVWAICTRHTLVTTPRFYYIAHFWSGQRCPSVQCEITMFLHGQRWSISDLVLPGPIERTFFTWFTSVSCVKISLKPHFISIFLHGNPQAIASGHKPLKFRTFCCSQYTRVDPRGITGPYFSLSLQALPGKEYPFFLRLTSVIGSSVPLVGVDLLVWSTLLTLITQPIVFQVCLSVRSNTTNDLCGPRWSLSDFGLPRPMERILSTHLCVICDTISLDSYFMPIYPHGNSQVINPQVIASGHKPPKFRTSCCSQYTRSDPRGITGPYFSLSLQALFGREYPFILKLTFVIGSSVPLVGVEILLVWSTLLTLITQPIVFQVCLSVRSNTTNDLCGPRWSLSDFGLPRPIERILSTHLCVICDTISLDSPFMPIYLYGNSQVIASGFVCRPPNFRTFCCSQNTRTDLRFMTRPYFKLLLQALPDREYPFFRKRTWVIDSSVPRGVETLLVGLSVLCNAINHGPRWSVSDFPSLVEKTVLFVAISVITCLDSHFFLVASYKNSFWDYSHSSLKFASNCSQSDRAEICKLMPDVRSTSRALPSRGYPILTNLLRVTFSKLLLQVGVEIPLGGGTTLIPGFILFQIWPSDIRYPIMDSNGTRWPMSDICSIGPEEPLIVTCLNCHSILIILYNNSQDTACVFFNWSLRITLASLQSDRTPWVNFLKLPRMIHFNVTFRVGLLGSRIVRGTLLANSFLFENHPT